MPSLREVETLVEAEVVGAWAAQADAFRRAVLSLWSSRGGELNSAEVQALASRLRLPAAEVNAERLLGPAAAAGDARIAGETAVFLSVAAVTALHDARAKPAEAVETMARRLRVARLDSLPMLLASIQPVQTSVSQMEATSSWAVHTAANEATVSAATQKGKRLVFIPERDACIRCIPHGGEVYPDTETPPIHPRCRCELGPFEDDAVPAALKRESVRSILRGFSLPSESEAARVRAAADLLRRGPQAPESVKRYARDAVKRGRFPRGRAVPKP